MVTTPQIPTTQLSELCINSIRFLAIDAVEKSNSGHPGLPMGAAPMAFVLWDKFLKFNPKNPKWFNRDRFVLSAGHGCMLYYALLHLTGYDSVSLEDLKQFRQWGSQTPGHPENHITEGIEVTTGPLGQGIANGVGLAMAEAHLAAMFNQPDCELVNHYTYVIMGDGCNMEGISGEACSLAGHLGLGKLIALYDDNHISIDGSTDLSFTEDVGKRYEAYGWHVQHVKNGNTDLDAIFEAIATAKAVTDRPSLIKVTTTIGYGSPNKSNTHGIHGSPLGNEEILATRKNLKWDRAEFQVPEAALTHFRQAIERGADYEREWDRQWQRYQTKYPERAAIFERMTQGKLPDGWERVLPSYTAEDSANSTRNHSGMVLNKLADVLPELFGGSADLAPSNKTLLKSSGDFQKNAYENRNLRFGVREHSMGAICNALNLHGSGLIPYGATFLIFTDYMRNPIRLSALSQAGVIWVMTHDSLAVGEDGPTHQPVEQILSLRAIPDLVVIRPADGNETSAAYKVAIERRHAPTLLALSRQNLPNIADNSIDKATKGAYVVSDGDATAAEIELILIGTGSEVQLCVAAAAVLRSQGRKIRVVSMPSWELFEAQEETYKESVLPKAIKKRIAIEAGTTIGWCRYVGDAGIAIGIDTFGASAPQNVVMEKFGFTTDNILAKADLLLS